MTERIPLDEMTSDQLDPIEARRASIRNLLDRAGHGVLSVSEAELLRQQVEAEQRAADHIEGALARMRDRAEVATVRADRAEAEVQQYAAVVRRLDQMVTAWQDRLPDVIRTEVAVDVIRGALEPVQRAAKESA